MVNLPVPTSTTLCHILPVIVKSIVRCRILFFFSAKGIMTAKKGGEGIMAHWLAYR